MPIEPAAITRLEAEIAELEQRLHFPNTEIINLGKTSHNIHVDNLDEVSARNIG
jgi:hypothetical protein